MKCNKCGAELRVVSEEYCKDVQGRPMYKNFAYCDYCKTKVPVQNNPAETQKFAQPNFVNATQKQPPNKKKHGLIIGIVVFILVCGIFSTFVDDSADSTNDVSSETQKPNKENTNTEQPSTPKDKKETKSAKPAATKKPKPTLSPKERKKKEKKDAQAAKEKFINSCKEYPYKKVLRNPKNFIGKKIKIKCQISQISKEGFFSKGFLRCYSYSGYGLYADDEYIVYDKRISSSPKLLDEDIITVYGIIKEPEEMTRALTGTSDEVFTIEMKYVKLHNK